MRPITERSGNWNSALVRDLTLRYRAQAATASTPAPSTPKYAPCPSLGVRHAALPGIGLGRRDPGGDGRAPPGWNIRIRWVTVRLLTRLSPASRHGDASTIHAAGIARCTALRSATGSGNRYARAPAARRPASAAPRRTRPGCPAHPAVGPGGTAAGLPPGRRGGTRPHAAVTPASISSSHAICDLWDTVNVFHNR